MKFSHFFHNRICLYFSCWNKKGYSIFASLGRDICISRLALHMYENVLLKSSAHGVIINTDSVADLIPWKPQLLDLEENCGRIEGEVRPDYFVYIQFIKKGCMAIKQYILFLI